MFIFFCFIMILHIFFVSHRFLRLFKFCFNLFSFSCVPSILLLRQYSEPFISVIDYFSSNISIWFFIIIFICLWKASIFTFVSKVFTFTSWRIVLRAAFKSMSDNSYIWAISELISINCLFPQEWTRVFWSFLYKVI